MLYSVYCIPCTIYYVYVRGEVQGRVPEGEECYGLLGVAKLHTAKYLLVITEARFVGNLKDARVYRVEKCDYLRYASRSPHADSLDSLYLSMYSDVISQKSFYFSPTYDLTHTIQRISEFSESKRNTHPVLRAEHRFFWNAHLAQELISSNALDAVVPVISGFVRIEGVKLGEHYLEFAVVSRRDHRRAGMRFTTRGLDGDGNAANFAETEQVVMVHQGDNFVAAAFVQIRGSIPLRWHQKPNLKWAPRGAIHGNAQANTDSAEKHFTEAISTYGDVFLVNLIDKKGNQLEMGQAFKKQVDALKNPRIGHTWFDFHAECKAMKWDNLSKLVREVSSQLDKYGSLRVTMTAEAGWGQGTVQSVQTGVFRTNCMDCLDRTNVVQSVFARNALHRQLHSLGISSQPTGAAFQPFPEPLETIFRDCWADHADVISLLYAGTGALKVDFTRTGKRTNKGAFDDGKNSLTRYFINNFYDGGRKNAVDALLGKLSPDDKTQPVGNKHIAMVRMTAAVIVCMLLAHIAGKATGDSWPAYLFGLFLGGLMLQKVLTVNGRSLVDKPVLDS